MVDRVSGALVYVTELAGVFGLPVVLLAAVGAVAFARRSALLFRGSQHRVAAALTVWLPVAVAVYVILFRLDPFPRHLLTLLPWFALFSGAGFSLVQGRVRQFGAPPWVLPVVATTWLALFVIDAERNFVTDPRNRAAAWLLANVPRGTVTYWPHHLLPSYPHANFSNGATPEVIVMDMLFANDYLSGQGWRNSMPTDYRRVFGGHNQARLERVQSLFRGTSGYREMARFTEGYFMPELRLPLRLVGDRSRSYLTEVIIFKRDSAAIGASEASRPPGSASVAAPAGTAPRSGTPAK